MKPRASTARRAGAQRLLRALRRHKLPRTIWPDDTPELLAVLDAHVLAFRTTPLRTRRKAR